MKNKVLNLHNDLDIVSETIKDSVVEKYINQFKSYDKSLECINNMYNTIYKIIIFNKKIDKNLTDEEFEYIYELNSNLEILEELFENSVYNTENLNTKEKVYTHRINMINDIKNTLNNIIHKKNFNI